MEKFCLLEILTLFSAAAPSPFFSTTPAFGHPFYIEGESAARAAGERTGHRTSPGCSRFTRPYLGLVKYHPSGVSCSSATSENTMWCLSFLPLSCKERREEIVLFQV